MEKSKNEHGSNLAKPSITDGETHEMKLSSLEEDAFNDNWNEALSKIEKRMEVDLKIPKERLNISFEPLGNEGAGFVKFVIV
ncbi:hypothetical protein DPMN_188916 [Dreissena polymorpha]|uniref:Uncharacterized protein n=1 Tax=Dreissena polymorpha TaxID=45954 RepID=A0A9D4DRS8_DREPO|nr:hypothetical protein DPMN_188916 [Dreissena polymorpha]